ncbi:kinase-like domain-containing protein [Blakeslea trispora]|nr:kinase-like domain-containing protein [Blakeslea trispora]
MIGNMTSPPPTLSRKSSASHLFAAATGKRRNRSKTLTSDTPPPAVPPLPTRSASTKKPLSRQRSISELVSRVRHTLKSKTPPQQVQCQYSSRSEDYDAIRIVGSGASASVYSAIYKPNQSVIAIKTVNLEENGLDDARLDALRKEIQIMTLCRHPHLLEVFQSFVYRSQLYIITPIMSAGSCHDLLARLHNVGFDEPIVACIIKQVAQGLDYLHENELVHRDIKSANLLIDFDTGIVKLADFGVSNHLLNNLADFPKGPALLYPPKTTTSSLKAGLLSPTIPKKARRSFVGTPCWMAPEILLNRDYDTKVDLWALGITILELACGKPPFAQYDPFTIFTMIIENPVPTFSGNRCRYTPSHAMQDFVNRCLHKKASKRISITEALNHPFLKRAHGPSLLQKFLAKRPELDKRAYLMSRQQKNHSQGSWDELEFLESTWDFNDDLKKAKPPPVDMYDLRKTHSNLDSPITPNGSDNSLEQYINVRLSAESDQRKKPNAFMMIKDYYY